MEMNKHEVSEKPDTTSTNSLILLNDDTTSFQVVIAALCSVLGWDLIQAEQVAMIVHHKGKYKIKSGGYIELETIKYQLEERTLTVELI
jgi:ATP-dependent Clp protease adaptor protein ClpS